MEDLPLVPDTNWYLYNEYDHISKIHARDIHCVYTAEINKVESNPRDLRNYETSNPCDVCVNTKHTFYECEILNNPCINFSLCYKRMNQLKMYQKTASISNLNITNETVVFSLDCLMGQE